MSENGEIKHASSGHCLDEDQHNNHEVELYSCSGCHPVLFWLLCVIIVIVAFAMNSSGAAWQKWNVVGNTIVNRDTGRCLDIQ